MKQTAVEWLAQQVESKEWQDKFIWHKKEVFQEAKEMEKEQIINAWIATDNELQRISAEKYYNETFKQQ